MPAKTASNGAALRKARRKAAQPVRQLPPSAQARLAAGEHGGKELPAPQMAIERAGQEQKARDCEKRELEADVCDRIGIKEQD